MMDPENCWIKLSFNDETQATKLSIPSPYMDAEELAQVKDKWESKFR